MARNARTRITQRMVDRLKPVQRETWIMDSEVIGFGIRLRPDRQPVYGLRWKDRLSKDRKTSISPVATTDLTVARQVAIQKLGLIAGGADPKDEAGGRERKKLDTDTVDDLIALVADELQSFKRSKTYIQSFKQQQRDYVSPHIGSLRVRDVSTGDIDRVLRRIRSTKTLHNRVRAGLSRMFHLAVRWGYRTDIPTMGAERTTEEARERLVTDEELTAILAALEKAPKQAADAIRLLAWTGSRPQELLSAMWTDFDLEQGVWTKPAQFVKQRRTHTVQLHELAVATLKRMKEEADQADEKKVNRYPAIKEYLFPARAIYSHVRGESVIPKTPHIKSFKKAFATVLSDAEIKVNTRPYDLRKAFITRLMSTGADLKTVMSLSGHTQVNVLLKYYAQAVPERQKEALGKMKLG